MTNLKGKGFIISELLKKRLSLLLAIALCVFMLAGCVAEDDEDADETLGDSTSTDTGGDTTTGANNMVFTDEEVTVDNIFTFVSLGEYKGIRYTAHTAAAVTEDDVDAAIAEQMSGAIDMIEVTDRAVQRGDTVIIDFEGFVDGVAFEGGFAEGADLVIGSGSFIPGFEEQIIGKNPDEEFDIHVTFPEDYHSDDLAGQPATFKIFLHSILVESAPELTDEFVMNYFGVETVAELRATIRSQIASDRIFEAENDAKYQVWSAIFRNSTVLRYPNAEINFRIDRAMMEFNYYAEVYGMPVEDLIYQMTEGMSYDYFIENEMRPGAIEDVGQDLVLRAIGAKEGLTITDAEFQAGVDRLVYEYGYENEEQFLEINGENAVRIALLSDKVIELLMANAIAE